MDLALNWNEGMGSVLKLIRMRSDCFDPRKLNGEGDPLTALRKFVAAIVANSGARTLPNALAMKGDPFESFATLVDYERDVLRAQPEAS